MKSLNTAECVLAQGGGIISEILKIAGGEALLGGASYVYGLAGVAGNNPPANENDNGGTSYGIDTYNTFGSLFGEAGGGGGGSKMNDPQDYFFC